MPVKFKASGLALVCVLIAALIWAGRGWLTGEGFRVELRAQPEVATGKTSEIKANVWKPPGSLEFIWRAERGTLSPQHSRQVATTYQAPASPGRDRVFLEIKEGTRLLWKGDVAIEVVKDEGAPALTPKLTAPDHENRTQAFHQVRITSFSESVPAPFGPFFTPGQGKIETKVEGDPDPARGKVARIQYDVSNRGDFGGVYLRFNVSDFQPDKWPVLTFWLRGDTGGHPQRLKVELKARAGGYGWRTLYLTITDQWQQFRLRLSDFQPFGSWDGMDEFVITIENNEAKTPKGAIFLDDVAFEG